MQHALAQGNVDHILVSRHNPDKDASASRGHEKPFDAAAAAGGKLPAIPWRQDLSSPHSAASSDFEQTFDDRDDGSLPAELLGLDPLVVLGCPKETGASHCLQLTASTRACQQTYKYGVGSAVAPTHPSGPDGQAAYFRKQNSSGSPTPGLEQTPLAPNHTMAYLESWGHQNHLENHSGQPHHGRVAVSQSSQPMVKQESMSNFTNIQERDLQQSAQLLRQYSSNRVSQPTVASSMSVPCTEPLLCQRYPDQATSTAPSVSSQPQPNPMLRSQPSEIPPYISPWYTAESPVYQCSPQGVPMHPSPAWWGEYAISSRGLSTFSQAGYQNGSISPAVQQPPQHSVDTSHQTLPNTGTMMQFVPSPEMLPVQGQSFSTSSALPVSDTTVTTPFSAPSGPVHESLSQTPLCDEPCRKTLPSPAQSTHTLPIRRRMSTGGVTRPSRVRLQNTHRRHNGTRKRSTSTGTASMGLKGARVATAGSRYVSHNAGDGPICVSFKNFTPDDSRQILSGVAPSGSSKTKAKREKEAREKRRAALLAVENGGGDVEAVKAALFGQEAGNFTV